MIRIMDGAAKVATLALYLALIELGVVAGVISDRDLWSDHQAQEVFWEAHLIVLVALLVRRMAWAVGDEVYKRRAVPGGL